MTVPYLEQTEFLKLLTDNGCKIVSDEHWNELDVVMMEKDGTTFPLDIEEVYYYPKVVTICNHLGIKAPPDHQKCYDQVKVLEDRIKDK